MAFIGPRRILLNSTPPGMLRGASLDLNFAVGQAFVNNRQASFTELLQCTRANGSGITGNELVLWADGHYTAAPPNTLALSDLGLQVYESRKNNGLWSRDLTQAAWIAVNVTPALTATGIDNATNSATTLIATAPNATILQSITLASGVQIYSVFLKRVSGTGTVNITLNGGVNWTAATLTMAWQRFSVTATVLNPIIGIQIVSSGDVIAADFSDIQPGTFLTPPIYTTTAAVTRAADVVTLVGAGSAASTVFPGAVRIQLKPIGYGTSGTQRLLSWGGDTPSAQTTGLQTSVTFLGLSVGTSSLNTDGSAVFSSAYTAATASLLLQKGTPSTGVPNTTVFGANPTLMNRADGLRPVSGNLLRLTFFKSPVLVP